MLKIGDYTVVRQIGSGSFASVYSAFKDNLNSIDKANPASQVAIKSVKKQKLNKKLSENLQKEVRILLNIKHINIKTDFYIHLVMELCILGDLSAFIKKKGHPEYALNLSSSWGGLHENIVKNFTGQLVSALQALRNLSLIHRDLKPQNILLSHSNSSEKQVLNGITVPDFPILKLADFGFARALPQQSLAHTLCGSPLYMAPEILRGDEYDAKIDLWSLGTILYEMLTSKPPYRAQNHVDLLNKIEKTPLKWPNDNSAVTSSAKSLSYTGSLGSSPSFPFISQTTKTLSDLKELVKKLLVKNPKDRIGFNDLFNEVLPGDDNENEILFTENEDILKGVGKSLCLSEGLRSEPTPPLDKVIVESDVLEASEQNGMKQQISNLQLSPPFPGYDIPNQVFADLLSTEPKTPTPQLLSTSLKASLDDYILITQPPQIITWHNPIETKDPTYLSQTKLLNLSILRGTAVHMYATECNSYSVYMFALRLYQSGIEVLKRIQGEWTKELRKCAVYLGDNVSLILTILPTIPQSYVKPYIQIHTHAISVCKSCVVAEVNEKWGSASVGYKFVIYLLESISSRIPYDFMDCFYDDGDVSDLVKCVGARLRSVLKKM